MVAHPSVKEFLSSKDLNEKRAGWITRVMEYDVDIHITKLVRGGGLYEQLTDDNLQEVENNQNLLLVNNNQAENDQSACWLTKMTHYL